ncbi:MAG: long-chain-fatty-acid--CoA ligase [Mycobacteriaceae bacterium]
MTDPFAAPMGTSRLESAVTLRDLVLARADDHNPGLRLGEQQWSWAEVVKESAIRAAALTRFLDDAEPPHIGVLMENTPEYVFLLCAAALSGRVIVGLNPTRRGPALRSDIEHSDCQVVLTDDAYADLLDETATEVTTLRTSGETWRAALKEHADAALPEATVDPDTLFMLIFTSGTTGDPKAVKVTHEKVAGPTVYLATRFGLTSADVGYVSMPMFHSNGIMAGWAPMVAIGGTMALAERFSASRFLPDVRRYGATYANYVGKPLSYVLGTPELPDDADNPLRLVFGNEANDKDIDRFAERFGCAVADTYSSTEGAVIVSRVPGMPAGSLGLPFDDVKVLNPETGEETPDAEFDEHGILLNADEATGEFANVRGAGAFLGYYKNPAAESERLRGGMYWSGDLAYRDADGFVYFAGRTDDWLRVDGENLAAAPVERILLRHPAIAEAAVYAVPDESTGDQLAVAFVLDGELDPHSFAEFLTAQPDLGTKQWPRYVTIVDSMPRTATNKVLKRELRAHGASGLRWEREPRGRSYHVVDPPEGR